MYTLLLHSRQSELLDRINIMPNTRTQATGLWLHKKSLNSLFMRLEWKHHYFRGQAHVLPSIGRGIMRGKKYIHSRWGNLSPSHINGISDSKGVK